MTNEKQNSLTTEKPDAFKKGVDTTAGSLTADKQKEKEATAAESEIQEEDKDKKKTPLEVDAEKSTDPQEEMQGPISSIMQNIKEAGEATDVVSKEEANEKKEANT